jgi:hypothetical protein
MSRKYPCPCCGYLTLEEPGTGTFEICPVCCWENDGVQFKDPTYSGGANRVSLHTGRENFKSFGAVSRDCIGKTRPPRPEEGG